MGGARMSDHFTKEIESAKKSLKFFGWEYHRSDTMDAARNDLGALAETVEVLVAGIMQGDDAKESALKIHQWVQSEIDRIVTSIEEQL